ncbi:MAG: hypothetical protein BGO41_06655 [Clostridiales bacterium 38-18]|nr:MAG: hypothetical protein BGO41_06655 [Clostridiales bacterium 38-18]
MQEYNYSEIANDVINYAFSEARDLGHQFVGTEHILLGLSLIKGTKVSNTFLYHRISAKAIRQEIIKLIGEVGGSEGIVDYTLRAKACLHRSHQYALKSNNGEILPEHIFMSIISDKQSIGFKVLSKLSFDLSRIMDEYAITDHELPKLIKAEMSDQVEVKLLTFDNDYTDQPQGILDQLAVNLVEAVKDQADEITVGRSVEIERLIQILTRKQKNNPCLIGEAGVGKTQIVRGLARKIAVGDVPIALREVSIYELTVSQLVAGTMYRGQFEERVNELIKSLLKKKNAILFIDELHSLVGMGATGDKSYDALSLLKPYLSSGQIRIIGATTYQDYQKFLEPDAAINRRLTTVPVEEPSAGTTVQILMQIRQFYEQHHHVIITEEAVKAIVELSVRYIRDRKLPDKAIDILDEACARKRTDNLKTMEIIDEIKYRLNQLRDEKEALILEMKFDAAAKIQKEEMRILAKIESNQQAKQLLSNQPLVVDVSDVERVVSDWARVPISKLSTHDKIRLRQLDDLLAEQIVGQEEAIQYVSSALKRFRMGIKDENKPLGAFLFVGPTGVGKTELSKAIADVYFGSENNLIKLDMSEFMERYSVSKLIGSPPGYEGTKDGGLLTNAIEKQPYSVVLFDEVEKAHVDVLNILLQLMDEGVLTDARGKKHDFRNALIILTSNIGSDEPDIKQVGFGKKSEQLANETKIREACKKYFRPEFINRIDEIIVFSKLSRESIETIVRRHLEAFAIIMKSKGIRLRFEQEVVSLIATESFSTEYGARPIKRSIDRLVKDPIASWLIENDSQDEISLAIENNEIKVN